MPTNQPPNSNELLDQAAVKWMRDQGELLADSPANLNHLTDDRIWATFDFTTHVQGPDLVPKTGGGNYDPLECPTYIDIKNWATLNPSVPDPGTVIPNNFYLDAPPAPPAPQNFNIVGWLNPNNSHTGWNVNIYRRLWGSVGAFDLVMVAAVNGVNLWQQMADTANEVQGVDYEYHLRYHRPAAPGQTSSLGSQTSNLHRIAGPGDRVGYQGPIG